MMRRPVIGLDLDECLGMFNETILKFYNNLKNTHFTMKEFKSFKYWEVWGGTKEETSEIVHAFFKSPMFLNGIPVVPGSQEALKTLKAKYDIYIVTSRHLDVKETTHDWLATNFYGLIDGILFGNTWSDSGCRMTKSEMLRLIEADVYIDDNLGYMHDCKDAVAVPILFGEYGWNRASSPEELEGITTCKTWDEVVKILMSKSFDSPVC